MSASLLQPKGSPLLGVLLLLFVACQQDPPRLARVSDAGGSSTEVQSHQDMDGVGGSSVPVPGVSATPLDDTPVTWADALPLSPGRLAVSPDGAFALATDDVGDVAYVVTLGEFLESQGVAFSVGSRPTRVALGVTFGFVALSGEGEIAQVRLSGASIERTFATCPSPQGLAVDGETLHVACRHGQLLSYDIESGELLRSLELPSDLRDIVVLDEGLAVSRFLTAEVLVLDEGGTIVRTMRPRGSASASSEVAWRMRSYLGNQLVLAHQHNGTQLLSGVYYGAGCSSIVTPVVSVVDPTAEDTTDSTVAQVLMGHSAGALDLATMDQRLVLAAPGNALSLSRMQAGVWQDPKFTAALSTFDVDLTSTQPCQIPDVGVQDLDVPVSVEFVPAGPWAHKLLSLTLSPAQLKIEQTDRVVLLHQEPRASSGAELFQMTVSQGIACASCHPEGRADAHIWNFRDSGPRRTQSIEGGASHLGAFHWNGEFSTFGEFIDQIMTERMGLGMRLSDENQAALLSFLDDIPAPVRKPAQDPGAAARGEELFFSERAECGKCHQGELLTDNRLHDVGTGGNFVTPPLIGVGVRSPLMHDGCASDLRARFGVCGGGDLHGKTSELSVGELDDLLVYMEGL